MIPDKDMRDLAEMLLKRSQTNRLEWKERDVTAADWDTNFEVKLGEAWIVVSYKEDYGDSRFALAVFGAGGDLVGEMVEFKSDRERDHPSILEVLFDEASRVVTGWDQVLQNVKEALAEDSA
jgi:hypothetical protein